MIAGLATVLGKIIVKSLLPLMQKAGVVICSGFLGNLIYSSIYQYNINKFYSENMNYNTNIAIVKDSNINKFISDNVSFSPLEVILSNLELTIYICLYL